MSDTSTFFIQKSLASNCEILSEGNLFNDPLYKRGIVLDASEQKKTKSIQTKLKKSMKRWYVFLALYGLPRF